MRAIELLHTLEAPLGVPATAAGLPPVGALGTNPCAVTVGLSADAVGASNITVATTNNPASSRYDADMTPARPCGYMT